MHTVSIVTRRCQGPLLPAPPIFALVSLLCRPRACQHRCRPPSTIVALSPHPPHLSHLPICTHSRIKPLTPCITAAHRTSTTRCARSRSRACSSDPTRSLTRSTPTRTTPMISLGISGVPPAFDSTQSSRCALSVSVSDPVERTLSRWVGSMMGCKLHERKWVNRSKRWHRLFKVCKGHAERRVVYRQRNRCSIFRRMLMDFGQWGRSDASPRLSSPRLTTITSSPITSTSGFLKCRNAVIAARAAQSNRFPSSARKCSVNRSCHTCE